MLIYGFNRVNIGKSILNCREYPCNPIRINDSFKVTSGTIPRAGLALTITVARVSPNPSKTTGGNQTKFYPYRRRAQSEDDHMSKG